MTYDINECRFSGKLSDIRRINTKTGTPMASCRLQCRKENIRCVGFGDVAAWMLSFSDSDRAVIVGKMQSTNTSCSRKIQE